jgi:hypothetical protein
LREKSPGTPLILDDNTLPKIKEIHATLMLRRLLKRRLIKERRRLING